MELPADFLSLGRGSVSLNKFSYLCLNDYEWIKVALNVL